MGSVGFQIPAHLTDPRVTAFRAVENRVRRYGPLKDLGVVVYSYDGSTDPAKAAGSDRPWIRLTPEIGVGEAVHMGGGQRTFESTVGVKVETFAPGGDWGNSMSLFGLVERAIYGDSGQERQRIDQEFAAAGINDVMTVRPAVSTDGTAEGLIEITTYVLG